jgi:hypothetical protein
MAARPSSTFAMSATTLLPAAAVGASNRTPGASLSSDDFRVERRANGEASSVMAIREQRLVAGRERLFG